VSGVCVWFFFFFSSRRRHTRFDCDWSSDVCSSDLYLLQRVIELVDREAAHARAGGSARIRAKLNGLADPDVIAALYRASQAGVRSEERRVGKECRSRWSPYH